MIRLWMNLSGLILLVRFYHCFDDQLYANPMASKNQITRQMWYRKYMNDHSDLSLIFLSTKQQICINNKMKNVIQASTVLWVPW